MWSISSQTVGGLFSGVSRDASVGQLLFDGNVFELGQVVADGPGQIELALLDQHHGRDPGKVLGHGHDLKERVFAHRLIVLDIGESNGIIGNDLAVAGDEVNRPRDHSLIDELLQSRSDQRQLSFI